MRLLWAVLVATLALGCTAAAAEAASRRLLTSSNSARAVEARQGGPGGGALPGGADCQEKVKAKEKTKCKSKKKEELVTCITRASERAKAICDGPFGRCFADAKAKAVATCTGTTFCTPLADAAAAADCGLDEQGSVAAAEASAEAAGAGAEAAAAAEAACRPLAEPSSVNMQSAAKVTQPASRSSLRPSRSVHVRQQIRGIVCRAAKQEQAQAQDDTAWCGDNTEQDEAPKPYSVPTSEELKQMARDFQYDGNLALPMLAVAAVLTWLASIFPGHA